MKTGRRMTALGVLTGGLLLIGFAAPSLADTGLSGPDTSGASVQVVGADGSDAAAPKVAAPADLTNPTDVVDCSTSDDPLVCADDATDGCDDQPPLEDPCQPGDGSDPGDGNDPCTADPGLPGCPPVPGDPGNGGGNGGGNGNGGACGCS